MTYIMQFIHINMYINLKDGTTLFKLMSTEILWFQNWPPHAYLFNGTHYIFEEIQNCDL